MSKRRDSKGRLLKTGENQRKDGKYEYKYTDAVSGKRVSIYSWKLVKTDPIPPGKKECVDLRTQETNIAYENLHGRIVSSNITVDNLFSKYMKANPSFKPATIRTHNYAYSHHIHPVLGRYKISDIKYTDVLSIINKMVVDGYSINTIKDTHGLINAIFNMAVRDDLIVKNPAQGAMKHANIGMCKPTIKKQALTIAEQERFLFVNKSIKQPLYMRYIIIFLLYTGCRFGEASGIQWNHCDMANRVIHIKQNIIHDGMNNVVVQTPKTAAGVREIPMLPEAYNALMEFGQYQCSQLHITFDELQSSNRYIFVDKHGIPVRNLNTARHINNIVEHANNSIQQGDDSGVMLPHITPHILRHTFCTRLCESGMNIKVVQKVMGHADISMTMDVYNDATKETVKSEFQKFIKRSLRTTNSTTE